MPLTLFGTVGQGMWGRLSSLQRIAVNGTIVYSLLLRGLLGLLLKPLMENNGPKLKEELPSTGGRGWGRGLNF